MRRAPVQLGTASLVAAALALAPPARAAVPSAEKVRKAVAATNLAGKRTQPLVIEVAVLSENGEVAATGQGKLDPAGGGRIDLTLPDGRTETHERTLSGYRVTRGGSPADHAPELLPPVQLLQAPSAEALAAALLGLGADAERVDLGVEGSSDCWVLGGRDPGPFEANGRPSLWIDIESRQAVRVDEAGGTHFRLGPLAQQSGVRFPAWIETQSAGGLRTRMEIRHVAPASAAPARSP